MCYNNTATGEVLQPCRSFYSSGPGMILRRSTPMSHPPVIVPLSLLNLAIEPHSSWVRLPSPTACEGRLRSRRATSSRRLSRLRSLRAASSGRPGPAPSNATAAPQAIRTFVLSANDYHLARRRAPRPPAPVGFRAGRQFSRLRSAL